MLQCIHLLNKKVLKSLLNQTSLNVYLKTQSFNVYVHCHFDPQAVLNGGVRRFKWQALPFTSTGSK